MQLSVRIRGKQGDEGSLTFSSAPLISSSLPRRSLGPVNQMSSSRFAGADVTGRKSDAETRSSNSLSAP